MGPADVAITHFGSEEALPRIGKETTLYAIVANVGGQEIGPVRAAVQLPQGVDLASGQIAQEIQKLPPGGEAVVRWRVISREDGEAEIGVMVSAEGFRETSAEARVKWKKMPSSQVLGPGGIIPPPKAAPTNYLVGAYYFPGWPTYDRWAVLDSYPERRPVLGYYREGDPEVADWHIKWALEHGISFFVYDWYWSAGARYLEHALHKGFLRCRYRDAFKFCLLWANHNPPRTSSPADMDAVVAYWLDNYFLLPNYLKVEGKPVVVIFSPHRFTEDMGSEEVKASFERMREACRKKGLAGLYLVACCGPNKRQVEQLESEGYDALSGYNYPSAGDRGNLHAPYAWMVQAYPEIWEDIDRYAQIPYIPVTEPGWDSRPWHGEGSRVRTGKSPALFMRMLEEARTFVDTPGRSLPGSQKIVLIEAWNEWGEGDYIEPHREWGFDYLDAVRQVFCDAGPHEDVAPGDVGLGPYELPKPEPIYAWEFEKESDIDAWSPQGLLDFGVKDGCLVGISAGNDPAFYGGGTDIDAGRYRTVRIRMRLDRGEEGQLFWGRTGRGFSEDASVRFQVVPDGEFHIYSIAVGENANWSGRIRSFRIDPCSEAGANIAIDYLRVE